MAATQRTKKPSTDCEGLQASLSQRGIREKTGTLIFSRMCFEAVDGHKTILLTTL
jgi:hypothetical protein